ncbi:Basigin [Chionoecetes opilio]|uniref:Basigin n=1 Tax=Chionoecetes opilio TaxID=41210 RepID=A0A8J4XPV0_CHIOP|nr:Basigin [Chionoecetes opilio]
MRVCIVTTAGQGIGGMQTGSEFLLVDDYTLGSFMVFGGGDTQPEVPMYEDVLTTAPAPQSQRGNVKAKTGAYAMLRLASVLISVTLALEPVVGSGGSHNTDMDGEGESESTLVNYTGQHFVSEHHSFYIQCNLTLFTQLKWTRNGKPILPGEGGYSIEETRSPQSFIGSRLSVENALLYHAGEYKCTTFSQRSHTVYVLSADLLASDAIHRVFPGFFFKLSCNMTNDDSTNFTLDWYKDKKKIESNDHVQIIHSNSSIVISDPKKEDAGVYRCQTRAGIPKDSPLVRNFTVIYFEIRKMSKSMAVVKEEQLTLVCPVDGKPFPKIVWRKDLVLVTELKVNDTRMSLAPNDNEVPDAKLIVLNAEANDRGNYTCNVTTHTNSFEVFTFVRVKDIYAALWPFLGIVVEVLLLGIIIFIFEKRRAKAEFEESDTDQGNDQ